MVPSLSTDCWVGWYEAPLRPPLPLQPPLPRRLGGSLGSRWGSSMGKVSQSGGRFLGGLPRRRLLITGCGGGEGDLAEGTSESWFSSGSAAESSFSLSSPSSSGWASASEPSPSTSSLPLASLSRIGSSSTISNVFGVVSMLVGVNSQNLGTFYLCNECDSMNGNNRRDRIYLGMPRMQKEGCLPSFAAARLAAARPGLRGILNRSTEIPGMRYNMRKCRVTLVSCVLCPVSRVARRIENANNSHLFG